MATLRAMELKCDGHHVHLPWGLSNSKGWTFHTAEEAEYPEQLCKTFAALATEAARQRGHVMSERTAPPKRKNIAEKREERAKVAAALGRQSRRYPSRLVPEYKEGLDVETAMEEFSGLQRLDWIPVPFAIKRKNYEANMVRILKTPRDGGVDAGGVQPVEARCGMVRG